jgi:hypothetical protein
MHDWNATSPVSDWLLHFRSATSQMSNTSRPMLSSTHKKNCGLQKTLKEKLVTLLKDSSPELVEGLTKAHRKLSDYKKCLRFAPAGKRNQPPSMSKVDIFWVHVV